MDESVAAAVDAAAEEDADTIESTTPPEVLSDVQSDVQSVAESFEEVAPGGTGTFMAIPADAESDSPLKVRAPDEPFTTIQSSEGRTSAEQGSGSPSHASSPRSSIKAKEIHPRAKASQKPTVDELMTAASQRHSAARAARAAERTRSLLFRSSRPSAAKPAQTAVEYQASICALLAMDGEAGAAACNQRGLEANQHGDTRTALRLFLRARELQPEQPNYALSAANMHLKRGEPMPAIALFEAVLAAPELLSGKQLAHAVAQSRLAEARQVPKDLNEKLARGAAAAQEAVHAAVGKAGVLLAAWGKKRDAAPTPSVS